MSDEPNAGRRRLVGLCVALPALLRTGRSSAAPARAATLAPTVPPAPFPEPPTLMVAGPSDGTLQSWADAIEPAVEQTLAPDISMRRISVGGADGVTGANQFEARGAPDGLTVLLAPGQAVLAWLIGDPRAQFDVGHWLPVMTGVTSGVVVARPTAVVPGGRMRIAVTTDSPGPDLPALLGVDLMGAQVEPVGGLTGPNAVQVAVTQGAVDAVLLRGHKLPAQLAAFSGVGLQPLFALGAFDEAGKPVRDPQLPDVPTLAELCLARSGRVPAGPLYDAWCAAAAAVQLEFGLVLPQLTPASMVALWRRAGMDAATAQGVQAMGASLGVRPLGDPAATANAAAIAVASPVLLELRRWLATRLAWQPRQ